MQIEKIIILLSTYNGEKFIAEQLDSLINQECIEKEILIRDDGSSDLTWSILMMYKNKYPDKIHLIQGANIGYAQSFTILLKEAVQLFPSCNFFAFCDQDDVWLPRKLKRAIEYLLKENDTMPLMYCSNTTIVDKELNFIRNCWDLKDVRISKERALVQSFATGCTMVFNREAVCTYLSHTPRFIFVHDFLMYQLCVFLGKVIWDENSYILYRQHGKNQIGKKDFKNRMKTRCRGLYKNRTIELQNRYFLEAFKDLLSVDDILLLSQIVHYRTNFFTRLSLFFNYKISYTSFEMDFFYRLKILLGYV